jgi:hypothetical protein
MGFIHFLNRWRRGEMIIFRRGQDRISWSSSYPGKRKNFKGGLKKTLRVTLYKGKKRGVR